MADTHEDEVCSPRDAAVQIVSALQRAGHVAYLAGGCVRDELLGFHPKDYDVATNARPDKVRAMFGHTRYVGQSFGVVQVHVAGADRGQGYTVEVATFRSEWGYEDGRRPTSIHYTDARSDAQRRDFTINGLFEDPLAGDSDQQIIDFVGGRADLASGLVRAIGDPAQRFGEDYLRMLRAVRFASRLGFRIEEATARALRPLAQRLSHISRERIGQELMWMLTPGVPPGGDTSTGVDSRSAEAIRMIQQLHLDGPVLNEQPADPPLKTVCGLAGWSPTGAGPVPTSPPQAVTQAGAQRGYATILAAWLVDRHLLSPMGFSMSSEPGPTPLAHRPESFVTALDQMVLGALASVLRRWRDALSLSNEHRDDLRDVLRMLPKALAWGQLSVAQRKRLLAQRLWPQVLALSGALSFVPGVSERVNLIERECGRLLAEGVSPVPWVDGNDLIVMGRKPGPQFRRLLEAVYDAQLDGTVTSRQEALAWVQRQG